MKLIRLLFSQYFIYGFSLLFQLGLQRILNQNLTLHEYGEYSIYLSAIQLFMPLLSFGSISRFSSEGVFLYNSDQDVYWHQFSIAKAKIVCISFIFLIGAAIISILDGTWIYILIIFGSACFSFVLLLSSYYVATGKNVVYLILTSISISSMQLFFIIVYFLSTKGNIQSKDALVCYLVAILLMACIIFFIVPNKDKNKISIYRLFFLVRFSSIEWIWFLQSLISIATVYFLPILVGFTMDEHYVGIITFSTMIGKLVVTPISAIQNVFSKFYAQEFSKGINSSFTFFQKAIQRLVYSMAIFLATLILLIPNFVINLFGRQAQEELIYCIIIICFGFTFEYLFGYASLALNMIGKAKETFYSMFLGIIFLCVSCLLLTKSFGVVGAALSIVVMYLAQNVSMWLLSKRSIPFNNSGIVMLSVFTITTILWLSANHLFIYFVVFLLLLSTIQFYRGFKSVRDIISSQQNDYSVG